MKKILLILLLFYYVISNSQIKIGYKLNEIFKNPKEYALFNSTTEEKEGFIYSVSMYKNYDLVYVFSNDTISEFAIYIPNNIKTIDKFEKMLKNKCEKIEENIWIKKTKYNKNFNYYTIEKLSDTIMGLHFFIY